MLPAVASAKAGPGQESLSRTVDDPSAAIAVGETPEAAPAPGEPEEEQPQDEAFDLILRLQHKSEILSQALVGLERDGVYYYPVAETARAVRFPVEADLRTGRLQGYFYAEENAFSLDAGAGTITVRGETSALPKEEVIVRDAGHGLGDIYVTLDVLNRLLPLSLELDFSDLTLKVKTRKKLPYEIDAERQKRHEMMGEGTGKERPPPDLAHTPNPYKMYGPQTLELSDTLAWDGQRSRLSNTASVSGQGDLLGATADYGLTLRSLEDGLVDPGNARFRLTRRDYGTGDLPLGLKLFQIGDVSANAPQRIEKTVNGRGVYLSTDPNGRLQSFDEITVEGNATPGWEVEIYSGNQLLDYGVADETGHYAFEGIPLSYGNNVLRTVLYGPDGQVEERVEEARIDRNMLKPGQTSADLGLIDYRKDAISFGGNSDAAGSGVAQMARVDHGLAPWLTGFVTATKIPTPEGGEDYLTAGGNFTALGGLGQVEAYKQVNGGRAVDARFARSFAGISLNLRGAVFKDFESRESGYGERRKTFDGEIRAGKTFDVAGGNAGLTLSANQINRANGSRNLRLQSRQFFYGNNLYLYNNLSSTIRNGAQGPAHGTVGVDAPLSHDWSARATLDYGLYPETDLDFAKLELNYDDRDRTTGTLTLRQGIRDGNDRQVTAGAAYDFGTFLGGVEAGWSAEDGVDVALRASTSFGPDSLRDGEYVFATKSNSYNTGLKIRLFTDTDLDGKFGPGDVPLEGARILLNGRKRPEISDADGYIRLTSAGAPGLAEIMLDRDALPNPFLVMGHDGYSTVVRARTQPFIDIPLIETGSVDGRAGTDAGQPLPGLRIQLVDQEGRIAARTATAFDGFYSFELVRPGTYVVQADPAQKVNVLPRLVSVTSEDPFAYGVDLILLEQAAEDSAADEADGDGGRVAHTDHAPVAESAGQPAPFSTDGNFSAVVHQVRIGEHPGRARLAMDLSAPALSYEFTPGDDANTLNVDLPGVAWDALRSLQDAANPVLTGYEVEALPAGGTRLILKGRGPLTVTKHGLLDPESGKGYRLYIDLQKSQP